MPGDVIRIKIGMSVNYVANSTREYTDEVPRAEWEAMTEKQREDYLQDSIDTEVSNHVDCWAYVEDEG